MDKRKQLQELEELLINAIDIDNLPAIERLESMIADLEREIEEEK